MKIIGHLDMDAFFAAVEERDKPRLKGKPIVVGSDPNSPAGEGRGRGVAATANYKAREYGIFSATPISRAWELSEKAKREGKPAAVFIGGNHKRYSEVSTRIMEILSTHSPTVQKVGLDEAYFELSFTGSYKKAEALSQKIKNDIKKKEKLTASIGIGPNKLIAKIASDVEKPDGLTVVTEGNAEKFLEPLTVRKIPGIGPKMESSLSRINIKTVRDLKKLSESEMEKRFGKWGVSLYQKTRGIGSTILTEKRERRSIGEETTFRSDSLDLNLVSEKLKDLCSDTFDRLDRSNFQNFRTIVLKVRFGDFTTKNRSKTFNKSISDLKTLEFEALRLLLPFFEKQENPKHKSIRLIGIRLEKLE